MIKGLIGKKLKHSYSKEIHELLSDYKYELIELDEEELANFMTLRQFDAINVTIPYKEKVIAYLDFVSDEVKAIKACNTIVNRDGKLYGYNTDYLGFKWMLLNNNIDLSYKKVCILGNGGASKACQAVVKELNAKEIIICKNNKSLETITYNELYFQHSDIDYIINTSPVGMYPDNYKSPIELKYFSNLQGVIDIVYNPLRTKLVLDAQDLKIKSIGGLEMLVAQAFFASELFMNKKLNENLIVDICKRIIDEKQNLVFIGMPSCGKSVIAKEVSRRLNRRFYDIDELIVQHIKMSIKEYFALFNEDKFREVETFILQKVCSLNNACISCGGGVCTREVNKNILAQNGLIIYIDRKVDDLLVSDDRPLSKSKEAILKLYAERKDLYEEFMDFKVSNNTTINDCVDKIIKIVK